jgi:endonuclease YncB( thermonuclease family)
MRIGLGELSVTLAGGALIGLAAATWSGPQMPAGIAGAMPDAPAARLAPAGSVGRVGVAADAGARSARFGFCHTGGGTNCVVDGDTFWMDGEKIRVADIDAPETHPSRCAEEERLGNAATRRLQALLNAGPVTLAAADRDTDRYGRKLRVAMRGGRSLGDRLVDEGLARRWVGHREPWC